MTAKSMLSLLAGAGLALTAAAGLVAPAAAATGGVTVATLNMRAGPGTGYPVVSVLPAGAQVRLTGCTADTSWCDTAWGSARGWVSAGYIRVSYEGQPRVVSPATVALVGLTVVAFNQAYWDAHYVGRPWYGRWSYYAGGAGRAGGTACGPRGCAHVGAVRVPGGAGHVGGTACGPRGCAHVGAVRGPGGGVVVHRGAWGR